jgi:hypothetical protein
MRFGVCVNSVGVHAVTRLWHEQIALGPAGGPHPQNLAKMIEGGRIPVERENDEALIWLASKESRHVTGSYFAANGLPLAWIEPA